MAKAMIDKDEWYPVYDLSTDDRRTFGVSVEVSDELLDRYRKVMEEFDAVQAQLRSLYSGGGS